MSYLLKFSIQICQTETYNLSWQLYMYEVNFILFIFNMEIQKILEFCL